jgi:hypothetical protein
MEYSVEPGTTSPQTDDTPNHSTKLGTKRQIQGAAVAGGVTGLVLLGPAVGLLAAGGAVLATTSGKGEIGKAARTAGDSVSDLGRSLKKFERKHSIKEKTSKGLVKGCDWVSKRLSKEKGSKTIT